MGQQFIEHIVLPVFTQFGTNVWLPFFSAPKAPSEKESHEEKFYFFQRRLRFWQCIMKTRLFKYNENFTTIKKKKKKKKKNENFQIKKIWYFLYFYSKQIVGTR